MARKSKEYWASRMQELEDEQYQRSRAYYKDVQEQFRKASSSLQMDIEHWYMRLADNNDISYAAAKKFLKKSEREEFKWTLEQYIKAGEENALDQRWMRELENASAKYHITRLEAMKLQLQQHAELLFTEYEDGVTDYLHKDYSEQYYRTAYEVSKGCKVGFNLTRLDERRIDTLIKHPWAQDGKNFSDRIWTNKEKLINNLHTELTQCVVRGESPRKAIDRLAHKMEVSKTAAGTLIMTESAAIASAAQNECFKDLDVESFGFDATLDGGTCEICQSMDSKTFKMSEFEVGVTAPPIHPRCRCCTVPAFDDWEEFGISPQRASRDPETGKTVYVDGSMKYADWKKQYVEIVEKTSGSGIIKLADTFIGRSVGAKARNYDVIDKSAGITYHFAEGSRIQNSEVFAGNGTHTPLHDGVAEGLTDEFGGDVSKWQHCKGNGVLVDEESGEELKAEVHWFQEETVGKVKFKVKRWLDD